MINFVRQLTGPPRNGHAREKAEGSRLETEAKTQPSKRSFEKGHFLNGNRNEAGHPTIVVVVVEGNGTGKGTKGAESFGSLRLQDERFRAAPLISETIVASTKNWTAGPVGSMNKVTITKVM